MQIVKGDRNSRLRMDEEKKWISKHKSQKRPSVPCVSSMERSCGEYHGRQTPWVSRWGSMQHPVRRRDCGKGKGQELGAKDLPEGRTLTMMMMIESMY